MTTAAFLPPRRLVQFPRVQPTRVRITREYIRARAETRQQNNNCTDLSAALCANPTTHRAAADAAYYTTNTVDPDMDYTGAVEFDDCDGLDNIEAHYASHGLRIMGAEEFFTTYVQE